VLALRLAFLGSVNLLPEEAYYWNYAQHLDIGYLDHPPMVAWLIWAGTRLFGDTEFAVRLGAYSCWIVAAMFCFLLTRNLYGRTAAFIAVLLLAVLPFFFGTGMIITPDAPLTAAWAGALYFLERALLGEQRTAWWHVGICVGLGLLSKYTIALLGPATILFMLLDPRSRMWFRRSSPYVAVLAAAVFFSPVIIWNAQHDWASFMFQGPQRLQAPPRFSLFHLLASIMVLLTPVGVAAIVVALLRNAKTRVQGSQQSRDRRSLFAAIFTLAPLSVFVVFSLFHQIKLDWTGPLWLAMLPLLAADIAEGRQVIAGWPDALRRTWGPTIAVLLLAYGMALHYLTLGLPGVGYSGDLTVLPVGWREFGRQAAIIEQEIESITGKEPLRVGTDKYFLSSQMAFYDPIDKDGATTTAGRGLFGQDSLMYNYWFPARLHQGQTIILFALRPEDLSDPAMTTKFHHLGPVREQVIYKRGVRAGRFFYRVGDGFRLD
jgi:dolichol-phosphate mannosyltransferase